MDDGFCRETNKEQFDGVNLDWKHELDQLGSRLYQRFLHCNIAAPLLSNYLFTSNY